MVHTFFRLIALCGFIASSVAATENTRTLEGRLQFPDKSPFNITTRITLNNAEYTTYNRVDGSFVIYDVPSGIHQLDIHSSEYHFGQVKIQLLPESMDVPKCLEYAYPGAAKAPIKYPLVLSPHATFEYFEERKGLSIFSLLKNPMVLMMLVSVGMMTIMPKMMEGLDPEEKEQMRKQMKAQQNPTQMLSQMWGEMTGEEEKDKGKTRRERRRNKRD